MTDVTDVWGRVIRGLTDIANEARKQADEHVRLAEAAHTIADRYEAVVEDLRNLRERP